MATQTATPKPATAPVAASPKPITASPKRIKKLSVETNGTVLTFSFPTLPTARPVVFDASKCNAEMRGKAEMHGWKQKISDEAAGTEDASAVRSDLADLIAVLYENKWSTRKAGEPREEPIARLAAAVAEVRKVTVEKALAFLQAATEDIRKAIAKSDKVAPVIARMKAGVKSDDVLGGLV